MFRQRLMRLSGKNSLPNNTMQGASVGSPGVFPTSWAFTNNLSLTWNVDALGPVNGIDTINARLSGTASGGGNVFCQFVGNTIVPAVAGQTWISSIYMALVGGTLGNITTLNHSISGRQAGGGAVESVGVVAVSLTGNLTRFSTSGTLANGSTVTAISLLQFIVTAAGAVDLTLQVGWPQFEQAPGPSTPVRTINAAVTQPLFRR